jgi:hypothetical protein
MNRKIARLCLLVLACLVQFEYAGAQEAPDAWYARQPKPKNIDRPRVFPGAFSIELPKDWQFVPGHAGTVFSIVEKTRQSEGGALVTLEYLRLQAPLDPDLIAGAGERELKVLQALELSGKQFTSQVKKGAFGPFIVIQYNRPGLSGGEDHVVQYSMPVGTTMYRLICVAPAVALDKYRPVFAHVAASFAPVRPGGS